MSNVCIQSKFIVVGYSVAFIQTSKIIGLLVLMMHNFANEFKVLIKFLSKSQNRYHTTAIQYHVFLKPLKR